MSQQSTGRVLRFKRNYLKLLSSLERQTIFVDNVGKQICDTNALSSVALSDANDSTKKVISHVTPKVNSVHKSAIVIDPAFFKDRNKFIRAILEKFSRSLEPLIDQYDICFAFNAIIERNLNLLKKCEKNLKDLDPDIVESRIRLGTRISELLKKSHW